MDVVDGSFRISRVQYQACLIPDFLLADVEDFVEYCKPVVRAVFVNQFVWRV